MGENDLGTWEKDRKIAMSRLDSSSKEDLFEGVIDRWAQDLHFMAKILISQVGKEKAAELIKQAKYDESYKRGQVADKKFPRTIAGFGQWNASLGKGTGTKMPWVVCSHNLETSENRVLRRATYCGLAEALLKAGAKDPETFEVVKEIDIWDEGRANGFNPNMKFVRTKFLLDGDDCCEFLCET